MPASSFDHDLTLVIPAYNEATRLPRSLARVKQTLDAWQLDYRVLVIDNGSRDATGRIANDFGPRFATRCQPCPGKGAAVREGMLAATGRVVAFTDADVPFDLAALRLGYELVRCGRTDLAFGARDLRESAEEVQRSWTRELATWGFRQVIRALISQQITDTQCGLKVFSHTAARAIFSQTRIDGFAFDAEVVYLAHRLNLTCERMPVLLVSDEGSTISIRRHALPMLWDVLQVRWNDWQGRYTMVEVEPVLLPFPVTPAFASTRRAA